jgi:hypothetical protein
MYYVVWVYYYLLLFIVLMGKKMSCNFINEKLIALSWLIMSMQTVSRLGMKQ